jgi:hypothetical protein
MTPLVYIAGPMTGLPNWNHPAFYAMEECLRQRGITADAIVLLPSWEASRGARWELWLALCLGLPVFVAPVEAEPPAVAPPPSGVVH